MGPELPSPGPPSGAPLGPGMGLRAVLAPFRRWLQVARWHRVPPKTDRRFGQAIRTQSIPPEFIGEQDSRAPTERVVDRFTLGDSPRQRRPAYYRPRLNGRKDQQGHEGDHTETSNQPTHHGWRRRNVGRFRPFDPNHQRDCNCKREIQASCELKSPSELEHRQQYEAGEYRPDDRPHRIPRIDSRACR